MSGKDDVLRARMVAPSCYPFELSPFNEFYRQKLVSSIIVIIPYLLAQYISSNIYSRLAVCNWLSFTLRLGDLSSLLIAIFFLKFSCIFMNRKYFLFVRKQLVKMLITLGPHGIF